MSKSQAKDLGMQGRKDTVMGNMKRVAGIIQRKFGQITGNREAQVRGGVKQAEGTAQAAKGQVEQKVDEALKPSKTQQ
jgi:uncharacterized protein YjbJ (UPF0337 family)